MAGQFNNVNPDEINVEQLYDKIKHAANEQMIAEMRVAAKKELKRLQKEQEMKKEKEND